MKKELQVLAVSALTTIGLAAFASIAKAETYVQEKLVYSCVEQGGEYMTVPQYVRETIDPNHSPVYKTEVLEEYTPVAIWTETLDSDHPMGAYTPKGRCYAVSARLTNLASSIGIENLSDMSKLGVVNHERVIYSSVAPHHASRRNVIMTLKPANRKYAKEILQLFQVDTMPGVGGDSPVQASPIYE